VNAILDVELWEKRIYSEEKQKRIWDTMHICFLSSKF